MLPTIAGHLSSSLLHHLLSADYYISLRGLNQDTSSESRARLMGEPYCIFSATVKNPTCCANKAVWAWFGEESDA
jgi:hypothetical protein